WPRRSPSPRPAPTRRPRRRWPTSSRPEAGAGDMRRMSYAAALETAMAEEMRRDARVFTMATAPSDALLREFGPARVRRAPISEAAMTGIAVGAAGCGFRPVANWRSVTFSFVAFGQVVNQACKIRYMFGGQRDFPIVFRTRSEEHTSELQSLRHLVCRLLL